MARLDEPRCKKYQICRKELSIDNFHYVSNDNLLPRNVIPVSVAQN